jgi:hypothetical protein
MLVAKYCLIVKLKLPITPLDTSMNEVQSLRRLYFQESPCSVDETKDILESSEFSVCSTVNEDEPAHKYVVITVTVAT